jgi:hypothetical protein
MRKQLNRGNVAALVLLGVGVTGTVLDPNGSVGIVLFGVAALAALYLINRPFRSGLYPLYQIGVARPKRFHHRRKLVGVVHGRTVAMVVAGMSVLFALWLTADLSRPLVYACWWSFCALAVWLISVTMLTARRSLRTSH